MEQQSPYGWGMVIDLDRCTGCQACVVACQAENNVPINEEQRFLEHRAKEWIRIERYWEGQYPDVKARFLPVLCQHCQNAPCEPVCPVYAIQHSSDGLNVQVYNRCVGTRYCGNNCPWNVRFFNWWEPEWPEPLTSQLNPDVTVRSKGLIEKCTFCLQRINRLAADPRRYSLLGELGTEPNVIYLKKVDPRAPRPDEKEGQAPASPRPQTEAGDPLIRREAEGQWLIADG